MARVTVSVDDSVLSKVDEEAHNRDVSRSQVVSNAIESYVSGVKQGQIELHNTQLELNKSQTEVMQLKRKISKLENQLTEKDKTIESKGNGVMQLEEKVNQTYADLNNARLDAAKYEMAFKAKDEEIAFLRAHLSQLSEKITPALPPGQEEAKKKGWWQFWK